jgi:hypothetical protein
MEVNAGAGGAGAGDRVKAVGSGPGAGTRGLGWSQEGFNAEVAKGAKLAKQVF